MIKVGIIARFNSSWSAGRYYVENILLGLEPWIGKQIEVTILSDSEPVAWSEKIRDPERFNVRVIEPPYSLPERAVNTISRTLTGKNAIEKRIKGDEFDVIFPLVMWDEYPFRLTERGVFWIPDFQEKHYPEYFTEQERRKRDLERSNMLTYGNKVVVSSEGALDDLKRFYPDYKCDVFVLPFAVFNAIPEAIDEQEVLDRFGVSRGNFFICPNQFWAHKNHVTLVRAMSIWKEKQGANPLPLLFSGKEIGFLGEGAADECKGLVQAESLDEVVRFLGFIDRIDLLVLIKHAKALLQPSLFEGWNTSIEDAKSLGTKILASDIPVHREQLPDSKLIEATSAEAWFGAMQDDWIENEPSPRGYEVDIEAFQKRLLDFVSSSVQKSDLS